MSRIIFAATVAAPLIPAAAFAHAMLMQADPGAGAVLKSAPTEIHLGYSEQLEPAFSTLAVSDGAGRSVESAPPVVSGMTMTARLKALPAGEYRVRWIAVSVDTHRTEGSYSFTVGPR